MSAAENLEAENKGQYSAYIPSLEAAYRVGNTVVEELTTHWDRYGAVPPGGK
jgi:purine nucleoside permease